MIVEGRRVLEGHDPLHAGFAVADRHSFMAAVEDGILDIKFMALKESAMVSAMAIERAE